MPLETFSRDVLDLVCEVLDGDLDLCPKDLVVEEVEHVLDFLDDLDCGSEPVDVLDLLGDGDLTGDRDF